MAHLIVITPEMHKIAQIPVEVKYRRPGNVIEYTSVEFEVFRDREFYKAVPLDDSKVRRITDLPNELLFQIKNGKVILSKPGKEEVIEDIVSELVAINIVETSLEKN